MSETVISQFLDHGFQNLLYINILYWPSLKTDPSWHLTESNRVFGMICIYKRVTSVCKLNVKVRCQTTSKQKTLGSTKDVRELSSLIFLDPQKKCFYIKLVDKFTITLIICSVFKKKPMYWNKENIFNMPISIHTDGSQQDNFIFENPSTWSWRFRHNSCAQYLVYNFDIKFKVVCS